MTEAERTECRAYLEKQIDKLRLNLHRAEGRPNNEAEREGLARKLRIHQRLLEAISE